VKKKKIDLVILAGGKGTRISSITKNIPKPLIKFGKISFLEHLINFYKKYDFDKIYILSGYKSEKFNFLKNKKINFIKIDIIKESNPMGTAGAIFGLKKKIKNDFLLINGDSYLDYNINSLKIENFLCGKKILKMFLIDNNNYKSNIKLSNLTIKSKNIKREDLMNSGIYLIKKRFLNFVKNKPASLELDLIPKLLKKGLAKKAYIKNNFFIDIGTPKNLKFAKKEFIRKTCKPCCFLDRDGVINFDYGYVHKKIDFKLRKNIFQAIEYLNKKNFLIMICTNQSGIGRGLYKEKDFENLQRYFKEVLNKRKIYIDEVFYCPHHPRYGLGKYKIKCKCRKPQNKMILDFIKQNNVDLKKSFMIGDKNTDEKAAKKSNLKFYYVKDDIFQQIKHIVKK